MRREKDVTITAEGRDKGKVFHLREMPAAQGERWAARALLLMARSGQDIGPLDSRSGLAGLAVAGVSSLGLIDFREVEPLMDEMFQCVTIKTDPKTGVVRPLLPEDGINSDIEEIATRVQLRKEILELHMGFSLAELRSKVVSSAGTTSVESSSTQT
jgi:hypothetical protein